jgi:hypothetical protein
VIDLTVFDEQLREPRADSLIEGERIERIGPLVCVFGGPGGGFVGYRDLGGIEGAELDALIAGCTALYAGRVSGSSGSSTGTTARRTSRDGWRLQA